MSNNSGRPRKACNVCKGQKIRCTGERPSCKRCVRLSHPCVYDPRPRPKPPQASTSAAESRPLPIVPGAHPSAVPGTFPSAVPGGLPSAAPGGVSATPPVAPELGRINRQEESQPGGHSPSLHDHAHHEDYIGIPQSLVLSLVEVYFDNVYNANLLLHKKSFLASLASRTASQHVVLSVCALAANFYRDENGHPSLRSQGFMMEWAKRAGKLVFQAAEDLEEENVVTFCNLFLFWYSQGSWRVSMLHRGNACQLLHIIGIGSETVNTKTSWQAEIRRRRFWACYLVNCHSSEKQPLFDPVPDVLSLTLPWPEEDFSNGVSKSPIVTLRSEQGGQSVFAELIRALTLWTTVTTFVGAPESSPGERLAEMHAIDANLSNWWRTVHPDFKLTPANMASVPHEKFPNVLLLNVVFHQCLCSLHSSIVPMFGWGNAGDETWALARQLSAQVAYEHACSVSSLLEAVSSTVPRFSAIPSYVAYAAYCGYAIQIPFLSCQDAVVKERARTNVRTNVKIINELAKYWKFAFLLQIYVPRLLDSHKKQGIILENEPKYLDPSKLGLFQVYSTHARTSILAFFGVLRSRTDGYARPGEESSDLGIKEGVGDASNACEPSLERRGEGSPEALRTQSFSDSASRASHLNSVTAASAVTSQEELRPRQIQQFWMPPQQKEQPHAQPQDRLLQHGAAPMDPGQVDNGDLTFDMAHHLLAPGMLNFMQDSEILDLPQLGLDLSNLDYFDT